MNDECPEIYSLVGTTSDKLLVEAEALYWRAIKLEIVSLTNTLHEMLRVKTSIGELEESHPSFLDLQKRLSIRTVPYVKAWCQWLQNLKPTAKQLTEYSGPFTNHPNDGEEVEVARKALLGENDMRGARGTFCDGLVVCFNVGCRASRQTFRLPLGQDGSYRCRVCVIWSQRAL
jgi:hypothetical protein